MNPSISRFTHMDDWIFEIKMNTPPIEGEAIEYQRAWSANMDLKLLYLRD